MDGDVSGEALAKPEALGVRRLDAAFLIKNYPQASAVHAK
jgi:hypothetical protein